jgi:hypothetical protein
MPKTVEGRERQLTASELTWGQVLSSMQLITERMTEIAALSRGLNSNDVILNGLYTIGADGTVSKTTHVPYASIAVSNHGANDMWLASGAPGSSHPLNGPAVFLVPARGFIVANMASSELTLFGTAGDQASLQVFSRPQPPVTGYATPTHDISPFGDGIGVAAAMQPSSVAFSDTAGANTAVTRTLAAVVGQAHRLTGVGCSWSGAAAVTGLLTVTDGATTIVSYDVPLGLNTPFAPPLPPGGLKGTINTAMTITLAAGGAGAVGKLNTSKLTA